MYRFTEQEQEEIQLWHLWHDIKHRATLVLPQLVELLLPGGKHRGDEYSALNPTRDDQSIGSFSINTSHPDNRGKWIERADADEKSRGSDVISWFQYVSGKSVHEAVNHIKGIIDSNTALKEQVACHQRLPVWTPIVPIPPEIGDLTPDDVVRLGLSLTGSSLIGFNRRIGYRYDNSKGEPEFWMMRYERWEADICVEKQMRPVSYGRHIDGRLDWYGGMPPAPRCLYGLPDLIAKPDAAVLIVEGEKCCETGREKFPAWAVITSANGSKAPHKSDWTPLKGRNVVIWPDADEAGRAYAEKVTRLLEGAGAASVRVVALPPGLPDKWDIAKPVPIGLDLNALLNGARSADAVALDGDTWEKPNLSLLRQKRDAPSFPMPLLGPFWADWASSRARAAAATPDYTASALLTAIGATLANVRRPCVPAQNNWSEPPFLWTAIVGATGEVKTPALRPIWALLEHAEGVLAQGFDDAKLAHKGAKIAAAQKREKWESEVKTAIDNGQAEPAFPREAIEPDEPIEPRIVANDATTEKLVTMASVHPRGLLLSRDELAGLFASWERSYGGGAADRAFYLEAYNGNSYTRDLVKNGEKRIAVKHLSIGVLGGIQPTKLKVITGGDQDGLANRFLYSWPSKFPNFEFSRKELDDTPAQAAIAKLVAMSMNRDEKGRLEPRGIPLTAEAENALEAFGKEKQEQARLSHGLYAGALHKGRGQALRLSAILEYAWWCGGAQGYEPQFISLAAVEAAIELLDSYFLPMAERVFGDAMLTPNERNAKDLIQYLKAKEMRKFNSRLMSKTLKGTLERSEPMHEAIGVLERAGLIRSDFSRAGSTSGQQKKDYEVNPLVFAFEP